MKTILLIAAFITFALTSCSNGERDFEAVKEGMSKEEVTSLLGERDENLIIGQGPEGAISIWHYTENDEIVAAVQFENDIVSSVEVNFKVHQKELIRSMQEEGENESALFSH